ncbi:hypothetical protein Tco_1345193, partial [Tanacetum coccineum]
MLTRVLRIILEIFPEHLRILFSIHSDDGNPSSVIIKQHYGSVRGSHALSWKHCQGDSSKLNLPDH